MYQTFLCAFFVGGRHYGSVAQPRPFELREAGGLEFVEDARRAVRISATQNWRCLGSHAFNDRRQEVVRSRQESSRVPHDEYLGPRFKLELGALLLPHAVKNAEYLAIHVLWQQPREGRLIDDGDLCTHT